MTDDIDVNKKLDELDSNSSQVAAQTLVFQFFKDLKIKNLIFFSFTSIVYFSIVEAPRIIYLNFPSWKSTKYLWQITRGIKELTSMIKQPSKQRLKTVKSPIFLSSCSRALKQLKTISMTISPSTAQNQDNWYISVLI